MVTAVWKETAAPVLSLKPATLPTHTPREGQRDAPDSAQAMAFVSTQGKVRGSFRRTGRPPQGPGAAEPRQPEQVGLCVLSSRWFVQAVPHHGRTAALKAVSENCLWRQPPPMPAHHVSRCSPPRTSRTAASRHPSGKGDTATSRGIPSALWSALRFALPLKSQGQAFGTALLKLCKSPTRTLPGV